MRILVMLPRRFAWLNITQNLHLEYHIYLLYAPSPQSTSLQAFSSIGVIMHEKSKVFALPGRVLDLDAKEKEEKGWRRGIMRGRRRKGFATRLAP